MNDTTDDEQDIPLPPLPTTPQKTLFSFFSKSNNVTKIDSGKKKIENKSKTYESTSLEGKIKERYENDEDEESESPLKQRRRRRKCKRVKVIQSEEEDTDGGNHEIAIQGTAPDKKSKEKASNAPILSKLPNNYRSLLNLSVIMSKSTSCTLGRPVEECLNLLILEYPDFPVKKVFLQYLTCQKNIITKNLKKIQSSKAAVELLWRRDAEVKALEKSVTKANKIADNPVVEAKKEGKDIRAMFRKPKIGRKTAKHMEPDITVAQNEQNSANESTKHRTKIAKSDKTNMKSTNKKNLDKKNSKVEQACNINKIDINKTANEKKNNKFDINMQKGDAGLSLIGLFGKAQKRLEERKRKRKELGAQKEIRVEESNEHGICSDTTLKSATKRRRTHCLRKLSTEGTTEEVDILIQTCNASTVVFDDESNNGEMAKQKEKPIKEGRDLRLMFSKVDEETEIAKMFEGDKIKREVEKLSAKRLKQQHKVSTGQEDSEIVTKQDEVQGAILNQSIVSSNVSTDKVESLLRTKESRTMERSSTDIRTMFGRSETEKSTGKKQTDIQTDYDTSVVIISKSNSEPCGSKTSSKHCDAVKDSNLDIEAPKIHDDIHANQDESPLIIPLSKPEANGAVSSKHCDAAKEASIGIEPPAKLKYKCSFDCDQKQLLGQTVTEDNEQDSNDSNKQVEDIKTDSESFSDETLTVLQKKDIRSFFTSKANKAKSSPCIVNGNTTSDKDCATRQSEKVNVAAAVWSTNDDNIFATVTSDTAQEISNTNQKDIVGEVTLHSVTMTDKCTVDVTTTEAMVVIDKSNACSVEVTKSADLTASIMLCDEKKSAIPILRIVEVKKTRRHEPDIDSNKGSEDSENLNQRSQVTESIVEKESLLQPLFSNIHVEVGLTKPASNSKSYLNHGKHDSSKEVADKFNESIIKEQTFWSSVFTNKESASGINSIKTSSRSEHYCDEKNMLPTKVEGADATLQEVVNVKEEKITPCKIKLKQIRSPIPCQVVVYVSPHIEEIKRQLKSPVKCVQSLLKKHYDNTEVENNDTLKSRTNKLNKSTKRKMTNENQKQSKKQRIDMQKARVTRRRSPRNQDKLCTNDSLDKDKEADMEIAGVVEIIDLKDSLDIETEEENDKKMVIREKGSRNSRTKKLEKVSNNVKVKEENVEVDIQSKTSKKSKKTKIELESIPSSDGGVETKEKECNNIRRSSRMRKQVISYSEMEENETQCGTQQIRTKFNNNEGCKDVVTESAAPVQNMRKSRNSREVVSVVVSRDVMKYSPKKLKPQFELILNEDTMNSFLSWTEKYQPIKARYVIGDRMKIKEIFTWLNSWKERHESIIRKMAARAAKKHARNYDSDSEFESDDSDDEDNLSNTLLVTGPCGCGTTAAVFACAKQMDFKVLELNSSMYRTGKRIYDSVAEAVVSHQVRKGIHKKNKVSQGLSEDVKGCKSLTKFFQTDEKSCNEEEKEAPVTTVDAMSLVLFEQVDVIHEEFDRGFWHGLADLRQLAKRPIILTANDANIKTECDISEDTWFEHISLERPSTDQILPMMQIMCLAEQIFVPRDILSRIIEFCVRDVRKILLQLQFWFEQGKKPLFHIRKSKSKNKTLNDDKVEIISETAQVGTDILDVVNSKVEGHKPVKDNEKQCKDLSNTVSVTMDIDEKACEEPLTDECETKVKTNDNQKKSEDIGCEDVASSRNSEDCVIIIPEAIYFPIHQDESFFDKRKILQQNSFHKFTPPYFSFLQDKQPANKTESSNLDALSNTADMLSSIDSYVCRTTPLQIDQYTWTVNEVDSSADSLTMETTVRNPYPIENMCRSMKCVMEECHMYFTEQKEESLVCIQEKRSDEYNDLCESIKRRLPTVYGIDRKTISLDVLPCLHNICCSETVKRATQQRRKSRRFLHYLDSVSMCLDEAIVEQLCQPSFSS